MSDKNFGNNYDRELTVRFFKKWWKLLMWVFIGALVVSVVASLLITPRYKSTATLFPTNSNRMSKAIMDYHYSLDFMDYGIERDCEYAIQILSSKSMEDSVCNHFNLLEHYGISANDPHKLHKLHEQYRGNVNVKRTEFLGVEVSVLDVDPQWAADMANYIASGYDAICHRIHHDRAMDASGIMEAVCDQMTEDIHALEDQMSTDPSHRNSTSSLIEYKCEQLADLQTRATQTKVDASLAVAYKFWLDKASPSDTKAWPKRTIIVLLGSFGALVMCILVLLLVDRKAKEEE
ncbi:MAG: hypothetical protein J6X62_06725 [Bacteroidales bacterium]|nr:hypothetical protein [Bacteroidales bacterium]